MFTIMRHFSYTAKGVFLTDNEGWYMPCMGGVECELDKETWLPDQPLFRSHPADATELI